MNKSNQMPRIKGGFCGCRTEYVGPDPVKNYAKLVAIDILKGVVIVAGYLGVWYLKEVISREMGWTKKPEIQPEKTGDDPHPSMLPETPTFTQNSLKGDIDSAIMAGPPRELRGENIYESDRVVIVSGTGVGKSILAMQLSLGIASGEPCGVFPDEAKTVPQRVLLIDAEQEEEDLFLRYGEIPNIPSNITRISNCSFKSHEELISIIHGEVTTCHENVTVVIDNITSLFNLQSAEKIRSFYSELRGIQNTVKGRGFKLTYIILCHECKSASQLTIKSIMGSGNIGNFATSVFALGNSTRGEDMRYLKVLKARRFPKPGNVYLLRLVKEPYLYFENHGEISEVEATTNSHYTQSTQDAIYPQSNNLGSRKLTDEQICEIVQLYSEGETEYALSRRFNVNRNTIKKHLKKHFKNYPKVN